MNNNYKHTFAVNPQSYRDEADVAICEALAQPFEFNEIELLTTRVFESANSPTKWVAQPVPYFDARAVMARLDEVVGPENWAVEEPQYFVAAGVNGCQVCLRILLPSGKEIVRYGESDVSDIEPIKGGASNALKRAFSACGNRTLYTYGTELGYYPCETKEFKGKTVFKKYTPDSMKKLQSLYLAVLGGVR